MNTHVCPASHAGFLAISLRRWVQDPEKILDGLIRPGETVADIGCGPGFFTLPMVRMVQEHGTVIAADLQQEMLDRLRVRAVEQGLKNTIHYHLCEPGRIGITRKVDFILAFYMVHEVPNPDGFFQETREFIHPGGRLLYVESRFHVSKREFGVMIERAEAAGWRAHRSPKIA